jgi:PAS domain S-box-containing protein
MVKDKQHDKTSAGKEVSCVVLAHIRSALKDYGFSDQEIFGDLPYPLKHFLDKAERIDWETYCIMLDRYEKFVTLEGLYQVGTKIFDNSAFSMFVVIAAASKSLHELYRHPSERPDVNKFMLATQTSIIEKSNDTSITYRVTIDNGYTVPHQHFHLLRGMLVVFPMIKGYQPAKVDMEMIERGARYIIHLPQQKSFRTKLKMLRLLPRRFFEGSRELHNARRLLMYKNQELQREISEKNRIQEELKASQKLQQEILDSMSSAIVTIDAKHTIRHINLVAHKLFNLSEDESNNQNVFQIIPLLEPIKDRIAAALASNRPMQPEEITTGTKDTSESVFSITCFPLLHQKFGGAAIHIDHITKTEERERQLQLMQRIEMISALSGGLAHDFNNILGGIIGTSSLLERTLESYSCECQKKCECRKKIAQYNNVICQSADHGVKLIERLLTTKGDSDADSSRIDLKKVLNLAIDICTHSYGNNISFQLTAHDSSLWISGNQTQMEQIFLNLIVNACQSMNDKPICNETVKHQLNIVVNDISIEEEQPIILGTLPPGSYWCTSITDTGTGIKKQELPNIFKPFYSTRKQQAGTGLGLSSVLTAPEKPSGIYRGYF